MPRPWRIRYAGAKYHVTCRGNGREDIFLLKEDRDRFLEQLEAALEQDEVVLYAFALMSNHYHLLVETPRANIERFMQRLNTAYGMYFRYKHSRPGHCFEGRYSAKVVSGDDYLIRLTRYIHLNPTKMDRLKKMSVSAKQNYLADWPWSSYRGYINRALEQEMVDYRWLGLMGCRTENGNRNRYRKYVEGFLGQQDELLHKAMTASRYAIGDKEFIEEAEEELKNRRSARAIYGKDVAWPREKTVELEAIEEAVENEFGISKEDLHYHGHRLGPVKALTLELCCQLTGKSQREIGRYFGYTSDASVGKQRKRLAEAMSSGRTLARKLTKLKKTVLIPDRVRPRK